MTTTNNTIPDNINPDGNICVTITIPDDTQWLWLVQKCLSYPTTKRFWRGENALTDEMRFNWEERVLNPFIEKILAGDLCPEEGTMSCEDIADCIETNEAVQEAIAQTTQETLQNGGYVPNPATNLDTNPPPTLSSSDKTQNLLPAGYDCEAQPQLTMGKAREIVRELHETAEDFFELIEYTTNASEALAMAVENVPVIGQAGASAIQFLDWVIETMAENYQAAYNQTVEDELACMLFCAMLDDCTMSIDRLIALYEEKGSITTPPPDDISAILDFIQTLPATVSVAGVAAFHWLILRMLSWGTFGGFSAAYLRNMLSQTSGSDYSYKNLCDDCATDAPQDYWRILWDFQLGAQEWRADQNTIYVSGAGFELRPGTYTSDVGTYIRLNDLGLSTDGTAWNIKSMLQELWNVDTENSGSTDLTEQNLYSGTNLTTLVGSMGNATRGARTWQKEYEGGTLAGSTVIKARSMRMRRYTNGGAPEKGAHWVRVTKAVIVGTPDANGNKPDKAHWWWTGTLPTGKEEFFGNGNW